jgi:hypothetical protein
VFWVARLNVLDASHCGGVASADLMSDPSPTSAKTPLKPPTKNVSRGHRTANSRLKKPAKGTPAPASIADAAIVLPPPDAADNPSPRDDWPEAEAASSGPSGSLENPKRSKRRRKKGKVTGSHHAILPADADSQAQAAAEPTEASSSVPLPPPVPAPPPSHPPRIKIDPVLLAQRAWKIYLSEVSEEGVALVGDNDAKELARRCFRLAEIFIEEQTRRR